MVNIKTLDLNLLRVFEAMMRHRNVSRSGDALGLTQPAVSAALGRLRDHLGDPLFVRVGNKMVPTARAEAIAAPVSTALTSLAAALGEAAPFDPATATETFALRGADFFSMRLMPPLAGRLALEAPGVTLRFLDSARGDTFDLLEEGSIDLALEQPMEPPPWVSRTLLFPSPFVLVAARDHPAISARGIAAGATLPLDLFCDLPHALRSTDGTIMGMTDAALANQGRARRVALVLPHFEAILHAVAQRRMISVVPVQLVAGRTEELDLALYEPPLAIPTPKMQLYWHSRNDKAPPQIWLRQRVLEEVARLWGTDQEFDRPAAS